jgi:2,3-bisphosphoglycerate-independent phosphoglycerate mutase
MSLGAGRIVYQDLTRIPRHRSEFVTNRFSAQRWKRRHRAGRCDGLSPSGVHSQDHILALADLAAERGVKQLYLHAFLDSRITAAQRSRWDAPNPDCALGIGHITRSSAATLPWT